MAQQPTRSFAEVCLLEAVARRLRAYLVIRPVTRGGPPRLISRFLAADGDGKLLLAAPETPDRLKVFLPEGWSVGLSFELGELWVQGRTDVAGHCQHHLQPQVMLDAVTVAPPRELLSRPARREPRRPVDPDRPVPAAVWFSQSPYRIAWTRPRSGVLLDRSETGLGIRLFQAAPAEPGTRTIIRLSPPGEDCAIVRGVLRYCTEAEDAYKAGFSDVAPIRPGEAVDVAALLAAQRD